MSIPTVLKECQRFLRVALLCKKSSIRIGLLEVPMNLVQIVLLLPFIAFMPYLIWFCFEKEFDLKNIAGAINLGLGALQILFIYLDLAMNNSIIINHMTELQRIVGESKLNILDGITMNWCIFNRIDDFWVLQQLKSHQIAICTILNEIMVILSFTTGCSDSPESVELYEKFEKRNSRMCRFFFKGVFRIETMLCGLYILPPLGYALFQFPSSEWWLLPFPTPHRWFKHFIHHWRANCRYFQSNTQQISVKKTLKFLNFFKGKSFFEFFQFNSW